MKTKKFASKNARNDSGIDRSMLKNQELTLICPICKTESKMSGVSDEALSEGIITCTECKIPIPVQVYDQNHNFLCGLVLFTDKSLKERMS